MLHYHLIHNIATENKHGKTRPITTTIYRSEFRVVIGLSIRKYITNNEQQLATGGKVDTGHERTIHHGWQTGRHAGLVRTHV